MKIALLANRMAPALSPLTDFTCPALLRVADKPLLIHAIESVAAVRAPEITVVVSRFADHVERILGDGARWGTRFNYFSAPSDEAFLDLARRIGARSDEDLLLVRGEMLRTPIIAEFLERAALIEAAELSATIAGVSAGISLMRAPLFGRLRGPNFSGLESDRNSRAKHCQDIEFPDARLSTVDSLSGSFIAPISMLRPDSSRACSFPAVRLCPESGSVGNRVCRSARSKERRYLSARDAASRPTPN